MPCAVCHSFLLAQRYVENPGFDIKLYVMGTQVYAVRKKSPLHPNVPVTEGLMPLPPELRTLGLNAGALFGLDIYGVDVLQSPEGWVSVDINDFPSFGQVPGAVALLAQFILHVARRAAMPRRHDPPRVARAGPTDGESVQTSEPPGLLRKRPLRTSASSWTTRKRRATRLAHPPCAS